MARWDAEKEQVTAVLVSFLRAAASEDLATMTTLGTDSLVSRKDVREFFRTDVQAAARELKVVSMDGERCTRHLEFRYDVNGTRRNGAADLVFDGARWQVRNVGYILEHSK
jgi:hypothetical protein